MSAVACSDEEAGAPTSYPDASRADAVEDLDPHTDAISDVEAEPDASTDAASKDSDSTDTSTPPAALRADPGQLLFEGVEIGESQTASITLANVGGRTLFITDASVDEQFGDGAEEFEPGPRWLDGDNLAVEPGTYAELDVAYKPVDQALDRGRVTVQSTDPNHPRVVVPIETVNAYADIDVPATLRFGAVDVGEASTLSLPIYNRGLSTLTIAEVTMAGDSSFSLAAQPPYTTPVDLERGEYIVTEVTYTPSDRLEDTARITIDSSDPDQSALEVGVAGNEPTQCIRLSTTHLDFGRVEVDGESTKAFEIVNCSQSRPLEVSKADLTADGGGAFTLEDAPRTPFTLSPTDTATIEVSAASDAPVEAIGTCLIASDDPQQTGLVVDLGATFVDP